MLKLRQVLAFIGFLSLNLFVQAERWACCYGISDGSFGVGTTECTKFNTRAECDKVCSTMCSRVAETDTKDVWD